VATLNRLLGNILSRKRKYEYSLFDKWILNSDFGIISHDKQFKQLYELKSTERTDKLYCELNIHDYKDLLKYSKIACTLIEAMDSETMSKLIFQH